MDRPDTGMAAIVAASLDLPDRQAAVAYLLAHRVPDRVIARLLSPTASCRERRPPRDA